MTADLVRKYGSCHVPAGAPLWSHQPRGWKLSDNHDLFALIAPHIEFNDKKPNKSFTATRDLLLIAPFDVNHVGQGVSLIEELYADLIGTSWPNKLEVVSFKKDWRIRDGLLAAMHDLGVDGWIHPIEADLCTMEVCIRHPAAVVRLCDPCSFQQPLNSRRLHAELGTASVCYATPTHPIRIRWKQYLRSARQFDDRMWTPVDLLRRQ